MLLRQSKFEEILNRFRAAINQESCIKTVAQDLGIKGGATLYGKLENQEGKRLTLEEAINITLITDDPVQTFGAIVELFGYHLEPNTASASASDLTRALLKLGRESGDIDRAFLQATDPDSQNGEQISPDEAKGILKEIEEAQQVIANVTAALKQIIKE